MKLEKVLATYKKKTIDIVKLKSLIGAQSDEELWGEVKDCEEKGLLSSVKSSGTNGNRLYTMYLKYRVTLPEEDYKQEKQEITRLHPLLQSNGVLLSHPEEYRKYREPLSALNRFLFSDYDRLIAVSRKERSFEIFGEEKQLDNRSFCALLSRIGITQETLSFYDTPEYCFNDYIPDRKSTLTLLICENKDIWFNIRRMMFENNKFTLFGVTFDGVVYGEGNKVTEKNALTVYTSFMKTEDVKYLYWGDIDREGLAIYIRLKKVNLALNINLFTAAYCEMLELAKQCRIPISADNREHTEDYSDVINLFDSGNGEMLSRCLSENLRIPQEIISYSTLYHRMR